MNKLDELLEQIQMPKGFEPKKGHTVTCTVCGRKAHMLNNGKGPLVCCGKAMIKSKVPVTEAGFEDKPEGWTDKSVKKYSKNIYKQNER